MKRIIRNIIFFSYVLLSTLGCEETILDKDPINRYSDPIVWSDVNLVEAYLNNVYNNVDYGRSFRGHAYNSNSIFGCEVIMYKGGQSPVYNTGAISADNRGTDFATGIWKRYKQIQQLNIFLEKIDQVSEGYPDTEKAAITAQTDVLKGEALFLRAYFYTRLCMDYGGVPVLNSPTSLGDNFLDIKRSTFEETVNFIVKDYDDAASLLKFKSGMEMGRATKEAALAYKSRLLLFAASNLTADGNAENELVGYSNPNRVALWTAARDAAKDVIDLGTCNLEDFGAPDLDAVAQNYFNFFKAYDLSSNEVIWGKMNRQDVGRRIYTNRMQGPNGTYNYGNQEPSGNFVDGYQMNDGSDFFDHFEINEEGEYINISSQFTNKNPYYYREPRFYGTVLYDSALWQPRFSDLADIDPVGIYDRRTRIEKVGGQVVSERFGLDTRQGPVQSWNGGYSGYLTKKFMDDAIVGRYEANKNIHINIRYAEVILNYAEALLELEEEEEAATYINMIRNRAGLPDFTGDIVEALRYERKIELFCEELRWYDIRRWKIIEDVYAEKLYGVDIIELKEDGVTTTKWKKIFGVQADNNFSAKMYWWPIATDEINKAPQLQQNPHY